MMADDWLFFNACGHPFGVLVADGRSTTDRQAWAEFYDTERARRNAEDRGVTCRLVDHDTYRAQFARYLLKGCDCENPSGLPVDALQWQHLTDTFGRCDLCNRPGRPLFRYQVEPDHFDSDQPWTDESLCLIEPDDGGCWWCDRPKNEPYMLCPPCFGIESDAERAALDAALYAEAVV